MKKAKEQDKKLTEKQKRFCIEYLIDHNGGRAAISAGYSEKTARTQANQLLSIVKVSEYIQELSKTLNQKLESKYLISKEIILNQYHRLAFSDIRDLYDEDGNFKKITDLDYDTAASLTGIETMEIKIGDQHMGDIKKVKHYDKIRALDSISKVMGYNAAEKMDSNVNITVDITEKDVELFKSIFSDKYK